MSLEVGTKQVLSTCKRNRRSTWGGPKSARNTDIGMKMTVYIEKDSKGRKVSRTVYE